MLNDLFFKLHSVFSFAAGESDKLTTPDRANNFYTVLALLLLTAVSFLTVIIVRLYRSRQRLTQQLKVQKDHHLNLFSRLEGIKDEAILQSGEREMETVNRLISAIRYRDIESARHMADVALYSRIIAKHLLPEDSPLVGLIYLAAPLHDVGKIGISDTILSKPRRLDGKEYALMKKHTRIGYDILKDSSSPIIQTGAEIALTHHERFDGSGYPDGLKGNRIPLSGRIVAVADYFDALVSERVYKEAWPVERVIEIIRMHSGTYFDPECVDAFLANLPEVLKIYKPGAAA